MIDKVQIVDNVLPDNLHKMCYELILAEKVWCLDQHSAPGAIRIAGSTIFDFERNIDMGCRSQALATVIYQMVKVKVPHLSDDVRRIQLGAKAAFQKDVIHTDHKDSDRTTVLFFLNKNWKKEWGGDTMVDGKMYEYKPNRALVYPSNLLHGGEGGTGSEFRSYVNFVSKND
jgi:hypothetical protein